MKLTAADTSKAVDTFLSTLEHPHTDAVRALRKVILAADPAIADGIKWNAPSYRTTEYFATTHLRQKVGVGLILHLGAKVRATATTGIAIADPTGLLTWLAPDRAQVVFANAADVKAKSAALTALIQDWIRHV